MDLNRAIVKTLQLLIKEGAKKRRQRKYEEEMMLYKPQPKTEYTPDKEELPLGATIAIMIPFILIILVALIMN